MLKDFEKNKQKGRTYWDIYGSSSEDWRCFEGTVFRRFWPDEVVIWCASSVYHDFRYFCSSKRREATGSSYRVEGQLVPLSGLVPNTVVNILIINK